MKQDISLQNSLQYFIAFIIAALANIVYMLFFDHDWFFAIVAAVFLASAFMILRFSLIKKWLRITIFIFLSLTTMMFISFLLYTIQDVVFNVFLKWHTHNITSFSRFVAVITDYDLPLEIWVWLNGICSFFGIAFLVKLFIYRGRWSRN